jgi:hypothetical protein
MGLQPARPNSSNKTTVSCDKHSDNYLHVLGMSNSNAVSPIRDDNEIHSLMEQQVVSTRDKPSPTVSCQLQSDILMNHCDKSHHRTVSSIRDPGAHHSSLEQQVASTRNKLAPCHNMLHCQMQSDIILQECDNFPDAVSSFRNSGAHHSSVGPQVASARVGLKHVEAAKKLAPCSKVLWNSSNFSERLLSPVTVSKCDWDGAGSAPSDHDLSEDCDNMDTDPVLCFSNTDDTCTSDCVQQLHGPQRAGGLPRAPDHYLSEKWDTMDTDPVMCFNNTDDTCTSDCVQQLHRLTKERHDSNGATPRDRDFSADRDSMDTGPVLTF